MLPHYCKEGLVVVERGHHCRHAPSSRACLSLRDRLPSLQACPLIADLPSLCEIAYPHPGLDPGSPANINTEVLRYRDYN